jgi:hypothetical protein
MSDDAPQSRLRAGSASVAALILALAVPLDAAGRRQDVHYAWWVTASFQPTDGQVEGIPVQMLDATWQRASVIRPSDLPAAARRSGDRLEDFGVALSIEADLDGDKRHERAVVGVFETVQGEVGRFLLVLGKARDSGRWFKRALFTVKGSSFSALKLDGRTLLWAGCLECDDECRVVPKRGRFRLDCQSCC